MPLTANIEFGRYFYRPQMKLWGKVMFLHLSVILFTGVVYPSIQWGRHPPPQGRHALPRQTPPPGRHTPTQILRDIVNKWAVRILLEFILVYSLNT